MNIKLLKFIVIFFGILIVFGLIILMVGIYHKFNNLKKKNNNSKAITLKLTKGSKFQDFYINNDSIIIKYKLGDTHIIDIYDLSSGNQMKKIELLK
jgi:heme/copper-type cytochrome/quinol oxidase subunit 2